MAKKKKAKRNPGMPVVLVNPSKRRKGKKRRSRRRKNPSRRKRSSSMRRRRNPRAAKWSQAAMSVVVGMFGGGIAYGINYGVQQIPTTAKIAALVQAAAGSLTSVLVAKFADERAAAGIAGGTSSILIGRVRNLIAMSRTESATETEAGALYARRRRARGDAGAVFQLREAGAIRGRAPSAESMSTDSLRTAGTFRREAGASRYVPGPQRWFGPHGWAANGVKRRYVSAHNSGRY